MAATGSTTPAPTQAQAKTSRAQSVADRLQAAVTSGRLTQAQADVMKQLFDLRKAAMDKLKTDEKGVVDQAVTAGTLNQAEAHKLLQHEGKGGPEHGRGDHKGERFGNVTLDQVKAKLDQLVQDGKLTQTEADKRLQQFTDHQKQEAGETNDAQANPTPAGN